MPLILLERTSRWAAAFRREMRKLPQKAAIPIREVRSLPQCQRELESSPHSEVGVEILPQNLAAMMQSLSELSRQYSNCRLMALAARGLESHELLLREAGAVHVVFSPRSLAPALRLARRHLNRAPRPVQTVEEAVWANLPWG